MSAHLQQFSKMMDFQRFTPNQLIHLLSCDYPVDCTESQVLETVLSWLQHNSSEREKYCHKLLSFINWSEVPKSLIERTCSIMKTGTNTLVSQVSTSESQVSITPPGIVNSRGLELAVVKVGGFNISGITNEITYYLPSVGKWRHLTTIPHVEQCNFGTTVLDNELYVIGGCFNQSLQENIHPFGFKYNPQQNKWSTISPMQRERCRFTLSVVGNRLYAIGGSSETPEGMGVTLDFTSFGEVYDSVTDTWTNITDLPGARAQHAATTLESLIFVTGGLAADHVLSNCRGYDTMTDTWEYHSPLLTPRADHLCFTFNGEIYVCGGWYDDENVGGRVLADTIECYDISTKVWRVVARIPTPRIHAGIVVVGSRLYIIGGFNSDDIFDRATGVIECFDLDKLIWTTQTSYPQDIWEHVCIPLYIPRYRDDMDVLSLTR